MYIALYFLLFLLYFTLQGKRDQEQAKRTFIYIITLALCLGSALRHMGVGNDTYAYFLDYEEITSTSWREVFQSVRDFYSPVYFPTLVSISLPLPCCFYRLWGA